MKRPWTADEVMLLVELVRLQRPWKAIGAALQRSYSSVRNRHERLVIQNQSRKKHGRRQHCSACGRLRRGHVCQVKVSGRDLVDVLFAWVEEGEAASGEGTR